MVSEGFRVLAFTVCIHFDQTKVPWEAIESYHLMHGDQSILAMLLLDVYDMVP